MATGLRQLIDTANTLIFGIDADGNVNGNVNERNSKTAEISGYSEEEAKAKPLVPKFSSRNHFSLR